MRKLYCYKHIELLNLLVSKQFHLICEIKKKKKKKDFKEFFKNKNLQIKINLTIYCFLLQK